MILRKGKVENGNPGLNQVLRAEAMKTYLFRTLLCLLLCAFVGPLAPARTIEFETSEVTAADVALSPDGQTLIFTMLGHLFRLPAAGGTAEQLTFGPYYDTDPVFSPDGTRVAFVSDRDGSEGNVFVLELANRQIRQITHEPWAARPAWARDGQAIVYLSFMRERATDALQGYRLGYHFSVVRRVDLNGGQPETVSDQPRLSSSVFHLPDGRLAWTVLETAESSQASTKINVRSEHGVVSTLHVFEGIADRVVASPAGDGLYGRRYLSPPFEDRKTCCSFHYLTVLRDVFLACRGSTIRDRASVCLLTDRASTLVRLDGSGKWSCRGASLNPSPFTPAFASTLPIPWP